MIRSLSVMTQEKSISNTRLKLEEAQYFFDQMKANLDNPNNFKNNLSAFASASRSVTFVMQSEYEIEEDTKDPCWNWYKENVIEALNNEEIPTFLKDYRNMIVKENKSPSDVFTVLTKITTIRYGIIGSKPENEEELKKRNSEQDSAATATTPTYYYVPKERELMKRYVWYFPDNTVKTNENRRYVVKTCEFYLKRLFGLVEECEKKCGER
jgi:hypothetical protein